MGDFGSGNGSGYSDSNRSISSRSDNSSPGSAKPPLPYDDWEARQNRKRAAEQYRLLGNESFKRGFLESAIDYYSKAINCNPENHEYYTNRALCYKKQNKWENVAADVRMALNFEDESVKAHYYLGQALLQLGDPEEGMKKLRKAKALAEHQGHPYSVDIDEEILRAKKLLWLEKDAKFAESLASFKCYFRQCIDQNYSSGNMDHDEYQLRMQQFQEIFDALEKSRTRTIPSYLTCKISMCLFKDPAITPSGHTYEREMLVKHLNKNGEFDPITRDRCPLRDIIPNYAIKEAVETFLDQNPWAYEE